MRYTRTMPDDSLSSPGLDTNTSPVADVPIRPEPASEASTPSSEALPASESASTQQEPIAPQDQVKPEVSLEPPQAPEIPIEEPVSLPTSPQTEPSESTASAEVVPPEQEPVKEEIPNVQPDTVPQTPVTPEAPASQAPPVIPSLSYPYYGSYPVTFGWGAQSSDETIKKKYQEWGLVGHNGIDFGLPEGTEVLACDDGTVVQVGDNGDFGISITIKHSWGISIYGHLQSFGVLVNDTVKKKQVIGLSGQTGFVTGPHLHFGIQPVSPDGGNGYGGYIDPTPYLSETVEKPIVEKPSELSEEKPIQEESPKPEPAPQEPPVVTPEPVIQQPDVSEEVIKRVEAMFDARVKENSIKGNQVKKERREQALQKIMQYAQEKKRVTNEQIRDLLRVSQSTASEYLMDLVNRGMLKTEGKGKATVYVF